MAPAPRSGDRLPIDDVLPSILAALAHGNPVVIEAPPGAGKTTRVPLALLDAPWLGRQKIVMLEPRQLAARAAARRMAAMLGEDVGETVGFRVRGETRVSASTRVEVVTEGILTRLLHQDPTLDGVGAILFDEFHERSIHADLGLALTLRSRELLRGDLRLALMSATLDTAGVASVLDEPVVITSRGRTYPVSIRHVPPRRGERIDATAASVVRLSLERNEGSVLVFLPGTAEIRRTNALLADSIPANVEVMPLFGDLPAPAQDRAIAPVGDGRVKVVLATSIAETSVTIDGVRVVVDCGLARLPRFSARSGMTRLETSRVSRASAVQRCGRAGRTAPGICYRLWDAADDFQLRDRSSPEILDGDLAPLALHLALAGVNDPSELRWVDPPPAGALAHARELLRLLGALDARNMVTAHGVAMSRYGMHPRLAHMIVSASAMGIGATACIVAALLEERDIFRRDAFESDADLRGRVAVAGDARRRDDSADVHALRRVRQQAAAWMQLAGVVHREVADSRTGELVALAFPERVARRRAGAGERFVMRNGSGVVLRSAGSLARSEFLAVAELDGRVPEAAVYLAAPLEASDVESLFARDIAQSTQVTWDDASGSLGAWERRMLGAIPLAEHRGRVDDDDAAIEALLQAIRAGVLRLPWNAPAITLAHRVSFAATLTDGWPDLSRAGRESSLDGWLAPHLGAVRRRSDLDKLDLCSILLAQLTWQQRQSLDEMAPTHVAVPSGSRIPVDYADPSAPSIAVRLQELFGLADTPRVGGGRVPLVLQLLSPAHRPVQVTRDLANFWRSSYFEVRRDLRARYPRHAWPEDPLNAVPTKRPKPRG